MGDSAFATRILRGYRLRCGLAPGSLTGMARSPDPWRRSISEELRPKRDPRRQVTAPDVLLAAVVLMAALAFAVWFFFFSGSAGPIPTVGPF